MATGTQARVQQLAQQEQAYRGLRQAAANSTLADARAAYYAASAEEDRLYQVYAACDGAPLVRDEARTAYLEAADRTIAALCKLTLALRAVYVRG